MVILFTAVVFINVIDVMMNQVRKVERLKVLIWIGIGVCNLAFYVYYILKYYYPNI